MKYLNPSVFGYKNKEKYPPYVSKTMYTFKNHVDLLLLEEEKDKKHFVLIINFNTFMYHHT